MSVAVQQRISPPVEQTPPNFSASQASTEDHAVDSVGANQKINFRDLIGESMNRIKEEREAKKNNDFSGAKTDAEFLEKLAESSKPQVKQNRNELDKDDFLRLFVAQLQHQDPLNPDNGAEMASKLAQFNGVEQMINMNTGLKKLIDSQNAAKTMGMVQYIGKEASLEGGRIVVKDGHFDKPSFSVPRDAPDATVQLFSPTGAMVAEQPIGFLKKGEQTLGWDGKGSNGEKVPDGTYVFKIAAKDADGAMANLDIKTKAIIVGVDLNDPDNSVNTTLGKLKLADIKSIGIPELPQHGAPASPGAAKNPTEAEALAELAADSPSHASKPGVVEPSAQMAEKSLRNGKKQTPMGEPPRDGLGASPVGKTPSGARQFEDSLSQTKSPIRQIEEPVSPAPAKSSSSLPGPALNLSKGLAIGQHL